MVQDAANGALTAFLDVVDEANQRSEFKLSDTPEYCHGTAAAPACQYHEGFDPHSQGLMTNVRNSFCISAK